MKFHYLSLFALLLLAPVAQASENATSLGTFKGWNAYTYEENGKKVCFMATKPGTTLPKGAKRGDIYLMVTHRPGENSFNVVSVVTGYTYKARSEVTATIGTQKFTLYTEGDSAWARDAATDKELLTAIRKGASLTVEGVSARGTKTTDTYALAGSGAASDAINKACNAK